MGNDNEPAEEVVIIAKGQERKGMSTAAIEIGKFVSKKKKCLHCGDEFEERASGRQNQKNFCSSVCRTRHNAKIYYEKVKNNEEYKKKAKERFDAWRTTHKDRFNNMMKKYSKRYQKRIRAERRKKEVCLDCGKPRDSKWITCLKCRERGRVEYRKKAEKLKEKISTEQKND